MMNLDIYLTADRFPLVRDIGWNQIHETYTHLDRTLDFDVFIYVTQGQMQVIEEGKEYIIKEKEHLFLKKGHHHWGMPSTPPGTSWYWIHFNAVIDSDVTYNAHSPLPVLNYYFPSHYQYQLRLPKYGTSPYHPTIEYQLNKLLEPNSTHGDHKMTQISIQVYQMFLELQKTTSSSPAAIKTGKADRVAKQVMAYLIQSADREFDSKQLSLQLNLNYSYISTTFKRLTGQSIIEAHSKLRMNKAIDLMRNSSLNIAEISEKLDYQNPFYFSRVFKKILGESPSSFMSHIYK